MPRMLERRQTAAAWSIVVAMIGLVAILNLEVEDRIQPAKGLPVEKAELLQPLRVVEPRPVSALLTNTAVTKEPRICRLPSPELPDDGPLLSTPLIESLPPIDDEELLGDISDPAYQPAPLPIPLPAEPYEPPVEQDIAEFDTDLPTRRRVFEVEEFDEDAELAANTSVDDVLAYFPAEDELSEQFKPRVQEVFTLARNGALHAARARFEDLLRELSQAKDASQMTDRHSRALAAGMRAIEEADDFVVLGGNDVNAKSLAAGHQTPMLHEAGTKWTLPHEALAMYHLYAQQKLSAAVEGEQAGSMMLFGVGKIYAQLAERDDQPQATRKSLTMYRSAVAAHAQNHLAANEAGVLLARAGRYAQAAPLLERAARIGGASVTHRNLAFVHAKLGDTRLAAQLQATADRLARNEVARGKLSAERGIAWVSPEEFNRRSRPSAATNLASRPPASAPQPALKVPSRPQRPPAAAPPSPATKRSPQPTLWW